MKITFTPMKRRWYKCNQTGERTRTPKNYRKRKINEAKR